MFVAMWFGEDGKASRLEMDNLFQRGLEAGIEKAGYRAIRSDIEPHNDFIMNKILGDIRMSPFVVADFTRHRNGVYFEAGFARGLGREVINTCKKSDFRMAHFDTSQLPHILWEEPPQLADVLCEWIRGLRGDGPFADSKMRSSKMS